MSSEKYHKYLRLMQDKNYQFFVIQVIYFLNSPSTKTTPAMALKRLRGECFR